MMVTGPVALLRLVVFAETGKARCSDQKAMELQPAAAVKMKARRVRLWLCMRNIPGPRRARYGMRQKGARKGYNPRWLGAIHGLAESVSSSV